MSFKKFISGVSAFAIAASAFAGMAVTANAETLYSQDYESATAADWTTATGGRFTPMIIEEDGNKYLSVNQDQRNNNGTTISSTAVSIAAGTDYTLIFDFKLGSSTDQTPAAFNIYDAANSGKVVSFVAAGKWTSNWIINDGDTIELSKTGGGKAIADLGWYTATLTRSGDKEYLTITDKADSTKVLDKKSVLGSATGGIGKFEFVTRRYNANFAIDNVLVRDVENDDLPSTPQGEFSVVYKTEAGTTLTKTSSGSGDVDSTPTLTTTDKADFVEDNQKYIYVSDNAADVKIAADNSAVVTVTVRAAATYGYTVKSSIGTVISSGTAFEGDAVTAYYPRYILNEGTLYMAGPVNQQYQKSFTPDSDGYEYEITYDDTQKENVVFHVEGEDIDGASVAETGYTNVRASQGKEGYGTDVSITTLPAGKYVITGAAYANTSTTLSVKAGEDTVYSITGTGGWSESSGAEFVLKEETTLTFSGGSGNYGLDYIYIVKTGEYVPAPQGQFSVIYKTEDGTTLTKTSSGSGDVDSAPVLASADKADFVEDGRKYTYVSDDSADVKIAADNSAVVTVICAEIPAVTEATVNYISGDNTVVSETAAVSDAFVGESYAVPYRRYVAKDGVLYEAAATNKEFRKTITLGESNEISVDVTAVTVADGETFVAVADGDGDAGNNANVRASNAAAARGTLTIADVQPGIYKIVYNMYLRKAEESNGPELFLGETSLGLITTGSSWTTDVTFENIEVTEAGTLSIHECDMLDTVVLYKTGDITSPVQTETIVIGDVNADNKANVNDINAIGKYIVNRSKPGDGTENTGKDRFKPDNSKVVVGDVNGDGKANVNDINAIGKYIVNRSKPGDGTENTGVQVEVLAETAE